MNSFLNLLKQRGNEFSDPAHRTRFFQYTVLVALGVAVMSVFGIYNLILGYTYLSLALFLTLLASFYGWLLVYRNIAQKAVYRCNSLLFTGLVIYLMLLGGQDNSMVLWVYVAPLVNYYLLGRREGMIVTLVLGAILAYFFFSPLAMEARAGYSGAFASRLLITYGLVALITHSIESFRTHYRREIESKNRDLEREIAEREKMARSLLESQQRYEAVYLNAAEGILLVDLAANIVECNPQMLEMLGYSEEYLLGRSIFSLMTEETLSETPPQLERLKRGMTIFVDRQLITSGGEILFCEQSGKMISDELIILLYRDISERKHAALALEQANRKLEELVHMDGLTQIANRRRFDTTLEKEWARMQREKKSMGIIIGDIDYFKQYNDIYGHQLGDDCLISVASLLATLIHRPADLVARYGGEEFAVLLPNTDIRGCMALAERMRAGVEGAAISHQGSRCAGVVTMSFGVAAIIPQKDTSSQELIAIADKALYRAKNGGRNQVFPTLLEIPARPYQNGLGVDKETMKM